MNKYVVTVPFAGSVTVEVDALDDKDAEDQALAAAGSALSEVDWTAKEGDFNEVEVYRRLVSGNVCYVSSSRVRIDSTSESE